MEKTVTIPQALWGGAKIFKYKGKREPFVGVAQDKLEATDHLSITLGFLANKPTVRNVDTRAFLEVSKAQGWQNKVGYRVINYLPISKLESLGAQLEGGAV